MGSALRVLITLALVLALGLGACGRRGSLDRPQATGPETSADKSTTMSSAPDRRLIIDRLLE
jgi:predicted small lipoprotein YifL